MCGAAHVVWHSLQISQEKMVGSLLYCRPFTVLVRPTMVDTCRRRELLTKLLSSDGRSSGCQNVQNKHLFKSVTGGQAGAAIQRTAHGLELVRPATQRDEQCRLR